MRISDWSSDVCSSDLVEDGRAVPRALTQPPALSGGVLRYRPDAWLHYGDVPPLQHASGPLQPFWHPHASQRPIQPGPRRHHLPCFPGAGSRSEEHTSELQSLMRISYAVFCFKKKKNKYKNNDY